VWDCGTTSGRPGNNRHHSDACDESVVCGMATLALHSASKAEPRSPRAFTNFLLMQSMVTVPLSYVWLTHNFRHLPECLVGFLLHMSQNPTRFVPVRRKCRSAVNSLMWKWSSKLSRLVTLISRPTNIKTNRCHTGSQPLLHSEVQQRRL
jgi:hypothetical protein